MADGLRRGNYKLRGQSAHIGKCCSCGVVCRMNMIQKRCEKCNYERRVDIFVTYIEKNDDIAGYYDCIEECEMIIECWYGETCTEKLIRKIEMQKGKEKVQGEAFE